MRLLVLAALLAQGVRPDQINPNDCTNEDSLMLTSGTWACGENRIRTHATDCTSITDGLSGELCYEQDADTIFVCEPTAGDCDTAAEWRPAGSIGIDSVGTAELDDAADTPSAGECLLVASDTSQIEYGSCAAATGDVTDVGDCAGPQCFNEAGSGSTLYLEGSTADTFETIVSTTDPTADHTWDFPDDDLADDDVVMGDGAGSVAYSAVPDCDDTGGNHLNYDTASNAWSCGTTASVSGDVTSVGDCTSGDCFTADGPGNAIIWEGTVANTAEVTVTTNGEPAGDVLLYLPFRNAALLASTTGTLTSGNCAEFDSSGNLIDSGGTCGGGGSAHYGFATTPATGATIAKGTTGYVSVKGSADASTTESDVTYYVPSACTASNFRVYVSTNDTDTADNTATLRDTGAGTSITVTIDDTVDGTGLFSDTGNTHAFSAGDTVDVEVVNTGSGGGTKNIVIRMISFECG